jgi:IclR family KDG regulon transcriptional repressor
MAAGDGTVGKALEVLDLVAEVGGPVRFSELQGKSNLPKATLYRLIRTLERQGMLSQDPESGTYSLGVRLVRLAHAAWRQSSLAPIAQVHLQRLNAELGETVHLAQLDGGQVLYVAKVGATRPVEMFSEAGKVGPAYCTGVGKAMLAWLSEPELQRALAMQSFHRFTPATITDPVALRDELGRIRVAGHAFDREEHEPGIICAAAPILTDSGRVLGAVSVTTSTDRRDLHWLEEHTADVKNVAARIAEDTKTWRSPEVRTPEREEPECRA